MRIYKLAFAIVASLGFFCSCTNDSDDVVANDVKIEKTFGISTITPSSRAYIDNFNSSSSTVAIYWNQTDKVTVLAEGHTEGDVFSFKDYKSMHNNATFTGKTYDATNYYVVYPAQTGAKLTNEGYVQFNIPNSQKAIDGTFDPAACVQVGTATNTKNQIDLKNICSFFYLTVGENCNSISVEAVNSEWHLAGTVTAEVRSGGNTIKSFGSDCTNKIELTGIPSSGGTFFIAFIPSNNIKSDIKVCVDYPQNVSGSYELTLEAKDGYQFLAANYYNLGTFGHK